MVKRRLFFALWPDAFLRKQIGKLIEKSPGQIPGRKVIQSNWHITLAFLGAVSETDYLCVKKQADTLHGMPFTLELDCAGFYKKPRVAWIGCQTVPSPLNTLVSELQSGLTQCGFEFGQRAFFPHVTVLRKATAAIVWPLDTKLSWDISEFVLVESKLGETGSVYNVIERWPLNK